MKRKSILELKDQRIFDRIEIFTFENFKIFLLFAITVFIVYFGPKIFGHLLILGYLVAFLRSKCDYYWFAFFFILYSTPLGLFSEGTADAVHRLPLFSLAASFSFSTYDLFVITAFYKALTIKSKFQYTFQKPLIILLFYFIILAFLAVFFHHAPLTTVIDQVRGTFYFSLLFSLPRLLPNKAFVYKFFRLIIPFTFIIFIGSIYFFISNGDYLYYLINPYAEIRQLNLEIQSTFENRFLLHGGQFVLIFIVFVFSLIQLQLMRTRYIYFMFLVIISYAMIIMAASRSWFVIFGIIFGAYLWTTKNKIRNIFYFSFAGVLLLVFFMNNEIITPGIIGAWNRTSTVFDLGQEESLSRQSIEMKATVRLPQQLIYIRENPVTGWGFTDRMADPDTGNFGLLVQVGFIGFALFLYFWFSYVRSVQRTKKKLTQNNIYRGVLNVLLASFFGLLLSHFTTNQIFGTHFFPVFLSTFFFLSDFFIREASNKTEQITIKT